MALLDHLGVSVLDIEQGRRQFHPVLTALGYTLGIEAPNGISWDNGDETEIIIFPIRDEADAAPHRHGEAGWQHLAFSVASREEVDRLHAIAMDAGVDRGARSEALPAVQRALLRLVRGGRERHPSGIRAQPAAGRRSRVRTPCRCRWPVAD